MNSMTYKGLTARIEFDERDGIFVSRVLGRRFDSADAGVLQAERFIKRLQHAPCRAFHVAAIRIAQY